MKALKKYIAILLCIVICSASSALSVFADSIDTVPGIENETYPENEEETQEVEETTSDTSSVDSESAGNNGSPDNSDTDESGTYSGSNDRAEEEEVGTEDNQADSGSAPAVPSEAEDEGIEEENQEEAMVGAALTISYNNGYPVLEAEDAKVFLAFLYNDSSILQEDLTDNPYYNLLIGNHSVFENYEEMDLYIYDFSVFVRDSMRTQESSSTENVTKLSSKLEGYLKKRMEDMPEVKAYKVWANRTFREGLSNIFSNQIAEHSGIYIAESTYEDINLFIDAVDVVNDEIDIPYVDVKEFTENLIAAVDGALYVLQNEFKGRSMYFNSYLSNRPNYRSADDFIFQTIMDYNALAARENSAYSKLLDSISGITGKDSWSNHIETLNHFAEYFYQLEQASFSTDPGTWSGSQESEPAEGYLYNISKLPDNMPAYPSSGQRYWIIFNEGFRNERLEMSTFDVTGDDSDVKIIWSGNLVASSTTGTISQCNQYAYTESEWEQIGTYHILSDKSNRVLAANVDVYDSRGNKIVSATGYGSPGKIETIFPTDNDRSVDKFPVFWIKFSKPVRYTNTGNAYLYEYDTGQLVETLPLQDGREVASIITSSDPGVSDNDLLRLNFDWDNIRNNVHYYVLIDAGALEFCAYDESIGDYAGLGIMTEGIGVKDEWDFTTIKYQYPTFENPTERTPYSICRVLFNPIVARTFYTLKEGTGGTCYGMCYTAGAYNNDYEMIRRLCNGNALYSLDENFKSSNSSYSLLEYIQLAQLYQSTRVKNKEIRNNKKEGASGVYNAVKEYISGNGSAIIICVSGGLLKNHAILPLDITYEDENRVEILVYDCNKPWRENAMGVFDGKSFLNKLQLYKTNGVFTGFSYEDYNKAITYSTIDDILDIVASMTNTSLPEDDILVKSNIDINGDDFERIIIASDEEAEAIENYLYWTDKKEIDIPLVETKNEITLTDGYKEIGICAEGGTNARIDLEEQTASVSSDTGEEKQIEISIGRVDGEDDLKNIKLTGESNTDVSFSVNEEGIQLTSSDENFIDFSVTVDGNEVELNNVDFSSTKNAVTVTVDEDNTITVTEDTDEDGENETTLVQKKADAAIVYGASLTLEGQIGVNIKLLLPESIVFDPDSYVVMEYNGEKDVSVTTPVSEAAMDSGRYVFTCPVAVKEINDPVSIRVYHGDGSQVELVKGETSRIPVEENCFRYAVSDYIASKKTKTTAIGELTRTMSDFGAAARLYFNYEAEGSVIEADLSGITADDLLDYKMELTPQAAEGIKIYGASLMLESETGINIKFSGTDDTFDINNYTFTVDGSEVAPTAAADGRYQINIGNIAAKDLDKMYTVTVTDSAGNSQSIRYGALSYAYSKLNSSSSGESIRNLSKCLYLYNQAANTYFND